jgi:hypothetical protein
LPGSRTTSGRKGRALRTSDVPSGQASYTDPSQQQESLNNPYLELDGLEIGGSDPASTIDSITKWWR